MLITIKCEVMNKENKIIISLLSTGRYLELTDIVEFVSTTFDLGDLYVTVLDEKNKTIKIYTVLETETARFFDYKQSK